MLDRNSDVFNQNYFGSDISSDVEAKTRMDNAAKSRLVATQETLEKQDDQVSDDDNGETRSKTTAEKMEEYENSDLGKTDGYPRTEVRIAEP